MKILVLLFALIQYTTSLCFAAKYYYTFEAPTSNYSRKSFVDFQSGFSHNCFIIEERKLDDNSLIESTFECYGNNYDGQLGKDLNKTALSVELSYLLPIKLKNVELFGVGYYHTCAATKSKSDIQRIYCWGYNGSGQLGIGTITSSPTPLEVNTNLTSFQNVIQIAGGGFHTCFLFASNQVKCFGDNLYGQLGMKRGFGNDTFMNHLTENFLDLDGGAKVSRLSLGVSYSCALFVTGKVACWGYNGYGQLGIGHLNSTDRMTSYIDTQGLLVSQLTTGRRHTCLLFQDTKKLKCFGSNAFGQLGLGSLQNELENILPQRFVDLGFSDSIIKVAAGGYHTCVLTETRMVACWGSNSDGQLLLGDYFDTSKPTRVANLSSNAVAQSLSVGNAHSCVMFDNGRFKCGGQNSQQQIGVYTDDLNKKALSPTYATTTPPPYIRFSVPEIFNNISVPCGNWREDITVLNNITRCILNYQYVYLYYMTTKRACLHTSSIANNLVRCLESIDKGCSSGFYDNCKANGLLHSTPFLGYKEIKCFPLPIDCNQVWKYYDTDILYVNEEQNELSDITCDPDLFFFSPAGISSFLFPSRQRIPACAQQEYSQYIKGIEMMSSNITSFKDFCTTSLIDVYQKMISCSFTTQCKRNMNFRCEVPVSRLYKTKSQYFIDGLCGNITCDALLNLGNELENDALCAWAPGGIFNSDYPIYLCADRVLIKINIGIGVIFGVGLFLTGKWKKNLFLIVTMLIVVFGVVGPYELNGNMNSKYTINTSGLDSVSGAVERLIENGDFIASSEETVAGMYGVSQEIGMLTASLTIVFVFLVIIETLSKRIRVYDLKTDTEVYVNEWFSIHFGYACIISWRWDIPQNLGYRNSPTLQACFARANELGFRYVLIDIVTVNQDKVSASTVLDFMVTYTNAYVIVGVYDEDSLRMYRKRFWCNVEITRYSLNNFVYTLDDNLPKPLPGNKLKDVLIDDPIDSTVQLDRLLVCLLVVPFAEVTLRAPLNEITKLSRQRLDLPKEEVIKLVEEAQFLHDWFHVRFAFAGYDDTLPFYPKTRQELRKYFPTIMNSKLLDAWIIGPLYRLIMLLLTAVIQGARCVLNFETVWIGGGTVYAITVIAFGPLFLVRNIFRHIQTGQSIIDFEGFRVDVVEYITFFTVNWQYPLNLFVFLIGMVSLMLGIFSFFKPTPPYIILLLIAGWGFFTRLIVATIYGLHLRRKLRMKVAEVGTLRVLPNPLDG